MNTTGTFYIPKTLDNWPWQRALNPHYEEAKAESNEWLKSFKPFNDKSQVAFDKCDVARLAALAYPYVSKQHLRMGCDLMNILFVVDEYTDVEDADTVREMADIVIDAIRNPEKPRPQGELILGELTRQFWVRGIENSTITARKHFEEAFTDYLKSVYDQALDRDTDKIRTVEEYFEIRRDNIASRPSYLLAVMDIDIPDEAFYHPSIVALCSLIDELLFLGNDLASYNKEQATGDDQHNVLTIVMIQFGYTLHEALIWVADYHKVLEGRLFATIGQLPTFGPDVDPQLQRFIQAMAMCVRANDCWSYESGRYFGSRGLEIQRTRVVPILPKAVDKQRGLRTGGDVVVPLIDM